MIPTLKVVLFTRILRWFEVIECAASISQGGPVLDISRLSLTKILACSEPENSGGENQLIELVSPHVALRQRSLDDVIKYTLTGPSFNLQHS